MTSDLTSCAVVPTGMTHYVSRRIAEYPMMTSMNVSQPLGWRAILYCRYLHVAEHVSLVEKLKVLYMSSHSVWYHWHQLTAHLHRCQDSVYDSYCQYMIHITCLRHPVLIIELLLYMQAAAARHTAALVIAKVAAIELPQGQWAELIPTLLSNMKVQPANPGLRHSTLESLGYVCEELGKNEEEVLAQEQINAILTSVVQVRHRCVSSWLYWIYYWVNWKKVMLPLYPVAKFGWPVRWHVST